MEIEVIALEKTSSSTISRLYIDKKFECFILEDKDRGLKQFMALDQLLKLKVKGKTAIPEGRYKVLITFSERFQKFTPILLDVPAYSGVRIHSGNTAADTEGCPLTGAAKTADTVLESRKAFNQLYSKILHALGSKEDVFITLKR